MLFRARAVCSAGRITATGYRARTSRRRRIRHLNIQYRYLNRLTQVHTSTDGGVHESREAHHRYFDYGPMARVEIGEHKVQAGVYTYDQLQRLKEMRVFRGADVVSDNEWVSATETSEYHSNYAYDANGNLVRLNRNGNSTTGIDMDAFAYNLTTVSGNPSNRLDYVDDGGTDYGGYDDIKTGQHSANYTYDKLGALVTDVQEGIARISWRRGDKKVQKIARDDADSPELEFVYNPFGQRVLKIERPRVSGDVQGEATWKYTYYTYDANGQVMATYDVVMSEENNTADLDELNIYGSGRIGVVQNGRTLYDNGDPLDDTGYGEDGIYLNILGQKKYELTNHLGNVNAVITDRKMVSAGGSPSIYEAVVIMKSDYYPFGMQMPGRNYQTDEYRYAYNGMEQDPEAKGQGNSYTTEFRQYDPRLGRWMSLDPLMMEFPQMSPYIAFNNNPIIYTDPYGLSSTNGGEGGTDFVRQQSSPKVGGEGRIYNNSSPPANGVYTIKSGDTFWGLEQKWGMQNGSLQRLNENAIPTQLKVGDKIYTDAVKKDEYIQFLNELLVELGNVLIDDIYKQINYQMLEENYLKSMASFDRLRNAYEKGRPLQEVLDNAEYIEYVIPIIGIERQALKSGGKAILKSFTRRGATALAKKSISTFAHAAKYGIKSYRTLTSLTKGSGLEVHHLIESRFAKILGVNAYDMDCIVLTKTEHRAFTKAWRNAIGYNNSKSLLRTSTATKADIDAAAREIYKDYPDILKALGL